MPYFVNHKHGIICIYTCHRLEQPGRLQAVLAELLDFGPLPVGPVDYVAEMTAECEEMAGLLQQYRSHSLFVLLS